MHLLHQSCNSTFPKTEKRKLWGNLESEIASEQARSAALRDAFEGRRARYATAETTARNAELESPAKWWKLLQKLKLQLCLFRFQADISLFPFHTWQGWAPCVPPGAELPPRSLHVRLLSKCMEKRLRECVPMRSLFWSENENWLPIIGCRLHWTQDLDLSNSEMFRVSLQRSRARGCGRSATDAFRAVCPYGRAVWGRILAKIATDAQGKMLDNHFFQHGCWRTL